MDINNNSLNITKVMTQLSTLEFPVENTMQVFLFPINANQFDYSTTVDKLLNSVADFALSRKTKEYLTKTNVMKLSQEARAKFRDWKKKHWRVR